MKKPYFSITENIKKLRESLEEWRGTPFHHHARIKGIGCDCIQFGGGVAIDCGLIDDFQPPKYSITPAGNGSSDGLLVDWFREHSDRFEEIPVESTLIDGDYVCFSMSNLPHHLGIVDGFHWFWHCPRFQYTLTRDNKRTRGGVQKNMLTDSTWSKRVSNIFRPV